MSSFLHSTVPPAFTVIWGGLKLSCLMTIMGFVALTGRASCAPRHTAERNATASGRNNFRTLQPWRCGEWTPRSQHAKVLIESAGSSSFSAGGKATGSLLATQRLLKLLRMLHVSLQKRSSTFERRLQLSILCIRNESVLGGVDHCLMKGDFMRNIFLVKSVAMQTGQLLRLVSGLLLELL